MPASLTTSTVAPAAISSTSEGTRVASFWSKKLTTRPAGLTPSACASDPDPAGVLGGDHVGAAQRLDQPRGGVPTWPNGVAASSSRPSVTLHSLRSLV